MLHQPETAHPSLTQLLEILSADPLLDIFNGKQQVIANHAFGWTITDLASWLISRTLESGATQAVNDLQRYLNETQIPFRVVVCVSGIEVKTLCDLGKGISLIPWDNLEDSFQKRKVFESSLERYRSPSAALVQQLNLPKVHVSEKMYPLSAPDYSDLHDALLCIGIVGPFAPEWIVSWLDPPRWVPVRGQVFSSVQLEGRPHHGRWTEDHCLATSRLLSKFQQLTKKKQDALRLPMQRLNVAMRRLSNVDRAIDLGIALEALFLSEMNDDRGELTFRLRLRMARYLRQDSEGRTGLFKTAGDLYNLRPVAIHTGQLLNDQKTADLLQEGCQITAQAIRRFIEDGSPDWMTVQLG